MSKFFFSRMVYDEGVHLDEEDGNTVIRRYCSKNFKCKNHKGRTDWCKKGEAYNKSFDWHSNAIPVNSVDSKDLPLAVRILYGGSHEK